MRGGGSDEMDPTCVPSGNPRPLGGYQPNMMPEPSSPASAWQYHSVVPKQEPVDHEEQNDSGVTSGSDFQSSSPGSDHSTNIPYSSLITEQASHSGYQSAYYSTPFTRMHQSMSFTYEPQAEFSTHLNSNGHNPLTPPNSEPILLPKSHYSMTPALNNAELKNEIGEKPTTLTPCTSPDEPSTSQNPPSAENNDSDDSLSRLQMSLEKSGFLPSDLSSKLSECSGENENKSDNETDEYDEQGLRIPKVNSHGKVKTFRCKQCDFIAVTKLDFWEHSKKHIKADKLLTCPRCPFVTEYKHHLEYHLRNHVGSKPFKCSQCNYSCVNKSMLNSHLKSHSNIYQFRCSDCSYATKYCHSLKLHLRKYKHEPDIVLNPDGTPNPLPIIDVYGTRRGPKVKGSESRHTEEGAPKSDQLLPFSLNQFLLNSPQQMQFPFAGFPFFGRFPGALPNPFLLQNLEQFARAGQSVPPVQEAAEETPAESMETETEVLDLSKPGGSTHRNRRKGRAFKLVPTHSDSSDEDEETTMFSNVEVVQNKETEESSREDSSEDKNEISSKNNKDDYTCQYCNINFGDPVLYTIHMGYHGYQNPFTCNMCGEECKDKVSFFLHIARTSHS